MHILAAFPSTYLKAADLQGKSINIVIHSVEMQDVGGDIKPVLFFQGADGSKKERGLILNKTNSTIIAELHGWETDNWPGKMITIYPARVEFHSKIVDGIRVQLPNSPAAVAKPAIRPPVAHNPRVTPPTPPTPFGDPNGIAHGDDEIPF